MGHLVVVVGVGVNMDIFFWGGEGGRSGLKIVGGEFKQSKATDLRSLAQEVGIFGKRPNCFRSVPNRPNIAFSAFSGTHFKVVGYSVVIQIESSLQNLVSGLNIIGYWREEPINIVLAKLN